MELSKINAIKGILHSTDASAGAEIALFAFGSYTARTLAATTEYLVITQVQIVSVPGGDIRVFTGADATPGTGEDIVRGTFGANSGIVMSVFHRGALGHKVYAMAPAGVVDAIVYGYIEPKA